MTLPCIHGGFPKAASSTLQLGLFARHSGIHYLGKSVDRRGEYASPLMEELATELSSRMSPELRVKARAEVGAALAEARAMGKVLLLSREDLFGSAPRRQERFASNLKEIFGPVRILMVVRNPYDWVESLYFQRLRGNNVRASLRAPDELTGYFTIQEYLEREWDLDARGRLATLRPWDVLGPHVAAVGRENVGVFAFERVTEDQAAFVRDVCAFLGVDEEEGVAAAAERHDNLRMTTAHVDRLRRVLSTPWRRKVFGAGSPRECMRLIGMVPGHRSWQAPPARAELDERWRDRITEHVEGQFGLVAREWGLPLERYGYPV